MMLCNPCCFLNVTQETIKDPWKAEVVCRSNKDKYVDAMSEEYIERQIILKGE